MAPARHLAILAIALGTSTLAFTAADAAVQLTTSNDTRVYLPHGFGSDRDFTEGIRLDVTRDAGDVPAWARRVPGFAGLARARTGWSVTHEMYTPDAIASTRLLTRDRPFVGLAYAAATISGESERVARTLTVTAGMVGPATQAERIQRWWHQENGFRVPGGWAHQLPNEPVLGMSWEERRRPFGFLRHGDVVPHVELTAGNLLTAAAVGATARVGFLPNDFGPRHDAPRASGRGRDHWVAYGFARFDERAVARNLLLDGSTFTAGPRVHRFPTVTEWRAGVELGYGRFGVRYTFTRTDAEFRERPIPHAYGSVSLQF